MIGKGETVVNLAVVVLIGFTPSRGASTAREAEFSYASGKKGWWRYSGEPILFCPLSSSSGDTP